MVYKTKVCQRCGKEYQPTGPTQKCCKECRQDVRREQKRLSTAAWRKANPEKCRSEDPEKHRARGAKWRKENPERNRARCAKWNRENPEKCREYEAKYSKANREKIRVRGARYRKDNPGKVKAKNARWCKANPERKAVKGSKRRALKYANTPLDQMLTSTEWLTILAEHNGHCHYCSKKAKLTLDHVIPLSKGGKHSKDNVVPACSRCNSSKGAKPLETWFVLGMAG